MERVVALKKLRKLLGKSLGYRIDHKAPTPDERMAAESDLPAAVEARRKLKEKLDVRFAAILAADAEYQALREQLSIARDRADKLFSVTRRRKITVGVSNGMFFTVETEGDSWEEVIAKLARKKSA